MSLIKSISGIRGTIGGTKGDNLTPIDIVECTAGYGKLLKEKTERPKIVIGRDGRISGSVVNQMVVNTLMMQGIDVIDLGLSTTPTVEMAVKYFKADAGVIITASHNPKHWNALKFLDKNGDFIKPETGTQIIEEIKKADFTFAEVDDLGTYTQEENVIERHIDSILALPYLDLALIKSKKFKVVVDCINSTGAISINKLLDRLNVDYQLINDEITGEFAHNPEPLPKHLTQLSNAVVAYGADLGISVDPDVDRLAFVMEDGVAFNEEYTLVAAADFILSKKKGNTVSNLSSTMALADVTKGHGGEYSGAAVGEVNVVNKMREVNAVIGGEGNGGVILPDLHYGRDALVGIVLLLNLLAEKGISMTALRKSYPNYFIVKKKIALEKGMDVDGLLSKLAEVYKDNEVNLIDGVKVIFPKGWVHMRKSNTEPIIRIYAEHVSERLIFQDQGKKRRHSQAKSSIFNADIVRSN